MGIDSRGDANGGVAGGVDGRPQAGTNASVTVTYDNSVTNTSFSNLHIDSMTGPISLVQTENTFSTSSETVGEFGTGSFSLLGGDHVIGNSLFLGKNNGSSGTVSVSAGNLTGLSGTNNKAGITIGNGTLLQSGGVINVARLWIAQGNSSQSLYSFSGGSASAANELLLG